MVAVVVSGDATECIPLLDDNGAGVYNKGRNNIGEFRKQFLGALVGKNVAPFGFRPGVFAPSAYLDLGAGNEVWLDGQVQTTGGAGTQAVKIIAARHLCYRTGQGVYMVSQEADLTSLAQPAADGTNPRWDLVCVMPYDKGAFPADAQHGPKYITVTGDPNVSPVVPALPAAVADANIIARILRPANDNTIAAGDIFDMRRGAGIHGTPRVLLPGDALSDWGLYNGEKRQRMGAFVDTTLKAAGAKILEDYWDLITATWRGSTPSAIKLSSAAFAGNAGIANAVTVTVVTLAIPDPGYPYRLRFSGSLACDMRDGTAIDFNVRDGSAVGTQLFTSAGGFGFIISRNNEAVGTVGGRWINPYGISGILTGARTLFLTATGVHGVGAATASVQAGGRLDVEIVPS